MAHLVAVSIAVLCGIIFIIVEHERGPETPTSRTSDDGVVVVPSYAVPKGGLPGVYVAPGMRGF